MREEQYNQMADALRKHPGMLGLMLGLNRVITLLTMAAYPMLLLYLFFSEKYEMLYHTVLVPGVAFVVVSIFRRVYNAPRPYEQMQIRPLIQKDTKGKSFPSRHVFSIFMIGMSFMPVFPVTGRKGARTTASKTKYREILKNLLTLYIVFGKL